MKRKIIIELIFIMVSLMISFIMLSFFLEPSLPISIWIFQFGLFLLLHFLVSSLRQLKEKFKNNFLNYSILVVSIFLTLLFFNIIELMNENNTVFNNDGMTFYPPLSAIPQTIENDIERKQNTIKWIYLLIAIIIVFAFITAGKSIMNFRLRNLNRNSKRVNY